MPQMVAFDLSAAWGAQPLHIKIPPQLLQGFRSTSKSSAVIRDLGEGSKGKAKTLKTPVQV